MKVSKTKPVKDDKVIISSEYYQNQRTSYLCSFCNYTLSKLQDAGQNNTMWFCTKCHIEFDPESENLRKESKITVPDRNIEPSIAIVDVNPDVSIRHPVPIRGCLAELQKKGLKITDYHTTEKE